MIAICKLNQRQSLWLNLASHFQNPQSVWSHLGRNKEGKNSLLVRFRRRFFDMYILSVLCVLTGLSVMWNLWDSSILPPPFAILPPHVGGDTLILTPHLHFPSLILTSRGKTIPGVDHSPTCRWAGHGGGRDTHKSSSICNGSRQSVTPVFISEDRLPFHFCF